MSGIYWNVSGVTYAGNGTAGSALHLLDAPTGLFINANDTLYISDSGNWRVLAYSPNATYGTIVAGTGVTGTALNRFSINMRYTFVDASDIIYVSDAQNHRVVRWISGGSTGVVVAGNGTVGTSLSQMNFPYGVWVDSNSNIFVVEYYNERVTKWAPGATTGVVVAGITNSAGKQKDR